MRRRAANAAAGALLAMAAAVCGAQAPPTSDVGAQAQSLDAPIATPSPAPSFGPPRPTVTAPSADIALVLPLQHAAYARAADAVRA
jgi:hypothetical protein